MGLLEEGAAKFDEGAKKVGSAVGRGVEKVGQVAGEMAKGAVGAVKAGFRRLAQGPQKGAQPQQKQQRLPVQVADAHGNKATVGARAKGAQKQAQGPMRVNLPKSQGGDLPEVGGTRQQDKPGLGSDQIRGMVSKAAEGGSNVSTPNHQKGEGHHGDYLRALSIGIPEAAKGVIENRRRHLHDVFVGGDADEVHRDMMIEAFNGMVKEHKAGNMQGAIRKSAHLNELLKLHDLHSNMLGKTPTPAGESEKIEDIGDEQIVKPGTPSTSMSVSPVGGPQSVVGTTGAVPGVGKTTAGQLGHMAAGFEEPKYEFSESGLGKEVGGEDDTIRGEEIMPGATQAGTGGTKPPTGVGVRGWASGRKPGEINNETGGYVADMEDGIPVGAHPQWHNLLVDHGYDYDQSSDGVDGVNHHYQGPDGVRATISPSGGVSLASNTSRTPTIKSYEILQNTLKEWHK